MLNLFIICESVATVKGGIFLRVIYLRLHRCFFRVFVIFVVNIKGKTNV